eukprot:4088400-Pyramimonas_sp.AAC.1
MGFVNDYYVILRDPYRSLVGSDWIRRGILYDPFGFVHEPYRIRWDSHRCPIGSDGIRIGVL